MEKFKGNVTAQLWEVSCPRRTYTTTHLGPTASPASPPRPVPQSLCRDKVEQPAGAAQKDTSTAPRSHSQDPHSQGTHSSWACIQHKWRLKLMPAQRECAAFCWLSQLVSQFPQKPAVCRRGWSSQAIRSKKTLSASLLFSSIYNYCVRELHNL